MGINGNLFSEKSFSVSNENYLNNKIDNINNGSCLYKNSFYRDKTSEYGQNDEDLMKLKPKFSEKKIAGILFSISFLILFGKLFLVLKPIILDYLYKRQLIRSDFTDELQIAMMSFHWETEMNLPAYILPSFCGLLVSLFTWMMIYIDSDEPGINPPTPFSSPTKERTFIKRRQRKLATCQVGYIISIGSGVVIFCLLYFIDMGAGK